MENSRNPEIPTPDADGAYEYPWGKYRRSDTGSWLRFTNGDWTAVDIFDRAWLDHYHPASPEPPRPFRRGDVVRATDVRDELSGRGSMTVVSDEFIAGIGSRPHVVVDRTDPQIVESGNLTLVSEAPAADEGEGDDDV